MDRMNVNRCDFFRSKNSTKEQITLHDLHHFFYHRLQADPFRKGQADPWMSDTCDTKKFYHFCKSFFELKSKCTFELVINHSSYDCITLR